MIVTIPITILKSGGEVTPVSLGSRLFDGYEVPLVTVVFSDNSEKLITMPDVEGGSLLAYISDDNDIKFEFHDGCNNPPIPYYEMDNGELPLDQVDMQVAWDSCSMDGDVPKGRVKFQGEDFSLIMDLSDNEDPTLYYILKDDVQIITT